MTPLNSNNISEYYRRFKKSYKPKLLNGSVPRWKRWISCLICTLSVGPVTGAHGSPWGLPDTLECIWCKRLLQTCTFCVVYIIYLPPFPPLWFHVLKWVHTCMFALGNVCIDRDNIHVYKCIFTREKQSQDRFFFYCL